MKRVKGGRDKTGMGEKLIVIMKGMVWIMEWKLIEEGHGEIYYNGGISWNVGGMWRKETGTRRKSGCD